MSKVVKWKTSVAAMKRSFEILGLLRTNDEESESDCGVVCLVKSPEEIA